MLPHRRCRRVSPRRYRQQLVCPPLISIVRLYADSSQGNSWVRCGSGYAVSRCSALCPAPPACRSRVLVNSSRPLRRPASPVFDSVRQQTSAVPLAPERHATTRTAAMPAALPLRRQRQAGVARCRRRQRPSHARRAMLLPSRQERAADAIGILATDISLQAEMRAEEGAVSHAHAWSFFEHIRGADVPGSEVCRRHVQEAASPPACLTLPSLLQHRTAQQLSFFSCQKAS